MIPTGASSGHMTLTANHHPSSSPCSRHIENTFSQLNIFSTYFFINSTISTLSRHQRVLNSFIRVSTRDLERPHKSNPFDFSKIALFFHCLHLAMPFSGMILGHSFVTGTLHHLSHASRPSSRRLAKLFKVDKTISNLALFGERGARVTNATFTLPHDHCGDTSSD